MKPMKFILTILALIGVLGIIIPKPSPQQQAEQQEQAALEHARQVAARYRESVRKDRMIANANAYFKAHVFYTTANAETVRAVTQMGNLSAHTFSTYAVVTAVATVSNVTPVSFTDNTTGYTARLHCTNHLFERLPGSPDWTEFDSNSQEGKAWFNENNELVRAPEMDKN